MKQEEPSSTAADHTDFSHTGQRDFGQCSASVQDSHSRMKESEVRTGETAQLLKCSLYKSKDLILDLLHSCKVWVQQHTSGIPALGE